MAAVEPPADADPDALTTMHVRRAVAGDGASLDWIAQRLTPLLIAHARYRLGNLMGRFDPEDLVNDAWVVALPRLADLTAREGRLTPVLLRFLSTVVLNRVRNLLQERARHGNQRDLNEIAADRSGTATQAMKMERASAVHAAIAELEEADREILLLRGVEQVSAKSAALIVGATLDAVNKRYQRALSRLREKLPGSVFDEVEA